MIYSYINLMERDPKYPLTYIGIQINCLIIESGNIFLNNTINIRTSINFLLFY